MNANDKQPIIDAMLDEWLGKRQPISLSANALSKKNVDPQRIAELEQALQAASSDLRNRTLASSASAYRKPKRYLTTYRVLAALAACLFVAAGSWILVNRDHLGLTNFFDAAVTVAEKPTRDSIDTANDRSSAVAAAKESQTKNPDAANSVPSKGSKEALSLDALPFNTQDAISQKSKKASQPNRVVAILGDVEVIGAIDHQMLQLWKDHDAKPAAPLVGAAWIGRVTQQLLARQASQEEIDAFAKKDSPAVRLETLHRLVDSPEFSQVWARRLAAYYLDVDSVTARDASPERRAFVQWIRNEINQSHRLDMVVKNIVRANGIGDSNAELPPSSHWWTEVGLRGETAPAEVIASNFLGTRASCSRCHDAKSVASADQARYWGIAAITHGIEVSQPATAEKPVLKFRKDAAPLFYERIDATMVAAVPSLPDGRPLKPQQGTAFQMRSAAKQNLAALNDWILQSDELAASQANFVWKNLFGQPLVTRYSLDDSEGGKERAELAILLGQQLRSNDFDLRKIVVWIAASNAFGLESIRHEGKWYLTATDRDMDLHRNRQLLFATFPAPQERSFRSLDKLASWVDASKVFGNERGNVLANPMPSAAPPLNTAKANAGAVRQDSKANEYTEGQVQYLVNARSLPKSVQAEVDRMVKSNLKWDDLVDHAFYISGSSAPTLVDREAAQRILDISGDKRLALSRIIAARL